MTDSEKNKVARKALMMIHNLVRIDRNYGNDGANTETIGIIALEALSVIDEEKYSSNRKFPIKYFD